MLESKKICEVKTIERRTKIVCTIGVNNSVEFLEELIKAGMNVVRMNFSHGDHKFHETTLNNARKAAKNLNVVIGIMLDTKGPEIRTGDLKDGKKEVTLTKGSEFKLLTDIEKFKEGSEEQVYVDYQNIVNVVKKGERVLIDDGLISCLVIEVGDNYLKTIIENTGKLGTKKGCNLPGIKVDLPALTKRDKEDLAFGVKNGVDFIAASFVRKKADVEDIRKELGKKGSNIKIISKIENLEGLENFDDILNDSDGIMVARGDLGVEIPLEKVVLAQKMMIAKCNILNKPVITATQMLETMIYNPRPTRAEATDVANAVLDGTDCVMLSGETAKGEYPVLAVKTMAQICQSTEEYFDYDVSYFSIRKAVKKKFGKDIGVAETIASSAVKTSGELEASLIITLTESGTTSRLVSKYKPKSKIIAVTQHEQTARQLQITRGVLPVIVGSVIGTESMIKKTY